MRSYRRAWQNFSRAVHSLALGEGPLQERLIHVVNFHLANLLDDEIPPPIQGKFADLMKCLSSREAESEDEGSVTATVRAMSREQAVEIVEQILEMYEVTVKTLA